MKKINYYNLGFTLLELLVVIAIIGILVALGTVSYSMAQKKGRDARRLSDLKEIQNALESYYAINGSYPDVPYPGGIDSTDPVYFTDGVVPTDPKEGEHYYNASLNETYGTDAYKICVDLEADGAFDGFDGAIEDECVSNLQ